MKKVFVSGQIGDTGRVREAYIKLKDAGFTITHDWTSTDTFLGGREDKLKNREEAGMRAAKDIDGVLDSNIYILISDNEEVGKGMYVELGAALALNKKFGKPDIYIVGALNHLSVFYLYPAVKLRESMEEVIKELSSS